MKKRLSLMLLCMVATIAAWAQTVITGTVVSAADGEPLIGASVKVKGEKTAAVTDMNGKFKIRTEAGKTLVFSYIAMETMERPAKNGMLVKMQTAEEMMDELVVTGYGSAKKLGSLVGSVVTVDNKKMEKAVTPNFTDALAGQVSGLSVLTSSGDPSKSASIRLRGINSINSSSTPLFILDGAPISSTMFNTLNPSDIQNITVLKDAASTAIYGSRAANGVIVITSKKGKLNEKANLVVKGQYGFSTPVSDGLQMMNSQQYIQFRDMIGQPVSQSVKDLVNNYGISTNWRDEVLSNNAPTYTVDAALTGGSENINYYLSFNHHSQEGLIEQSKMHREALRANVEARLNRWFKAGVQANLGTNSYQQNNEAEATDGLYTSNPMIFSRLALPYDAPNYYSFDENGNIIWGDRADKLKYSGLSHPSFVNENRSYKKNNLTLMLNAFEQLNPIEGLTIRAQQAMDGYDYTQDNRYIPYEAFTTPMGSSVAASEGYVYNSFSRYASYTFTHTIEYRKKVKGHNFSALLGQESIFSRSRSFGVFTEGQTDPRQLRLTDGTSIAIGNLSDSRAEESFNSFFATFAYDFDGKYFLDASYRADGSSKFAPGHRWGHFYSVGGMWDLKKENFLKDVDWLDLLQARATYGLVGNSTGAGSYDYYGLFGTGSMYNGQSSMGISNPSNSTLTWEKVGSFNAGVTFGFMDRVVLNVDAYRRKTTDMLMKIPFSYTTGFGGGMGNIGAMVNKGFDADVNVKILKSNDFDWTLKANVNYNKNEITELFAGRDEYIIANTGQKLEVGKPYGEFYMVEYAGVDPRDGKPMWYDIDGNLTKVYNEERDSKFTGKQRFAPWSGGFGTSFSWKGLSITADFAWQAGKYMTNNDNYFLKNANQGTSFNQSVDMLNIWTKPGDITDIPKYGEQVQYDTHLLEDASFLRMKNLIVQYSFPEKWMKATKGIQNAKVFFVGRNLFTATKFSGYDPEPDINLVKFNYPNTRQFVFGMELTF
ncbi:MAG: TonB-dependent receptor [Bacteroidaceae bacterium]|nr:TonB-dependent receptor [Bacteroidaceae bacterium]